MNKIEEKTKRDAEIGAFLIEQIEMRHAWANSIRTRCRADCVSCAIIKATTRRFPEYNEKET